MRGLDGDWAHDVRVIFSGNVDHSLRVTALQGNLVSPDHIGEVSRGLEGVIGVNHQCPDVCIPFPFFRNYPASTFSVSD